MTSRLSIEQLERLKSIMNTMLLEARNSNWPELSRLDSERRIVMNYPKDACETYRAALSRPAISSGQRPFALEPSARTMPSSRDETHSAPVARGTDTSAPDERYRRLSNEVMDLDVEIRKTIEQAKEALLTESRGMRAQVNAKKGYEETSKMKSRSYS